MRVLATIGFSFSAGVFLAALLPWDGWQLYAAAGAALLALVWLLAARRSTCFRRGLLILLPLALIPVASRASAAMAVLTLRPMRTSQYSAMTRGGAPVVFAAIVLAAVCGLSVLLWDSFAPLAAAVCYWLAAWYAFWQLDGMSGDVSGFALTIAELGGAAVLVLWR